MASIDVLQGNLAGGFLTFIRLVRASFWLLDEGKNVFEVGWERTSAVRGVLASA
jgi:hypothetical protein